jgi:hypothetical protein
MWSMLTSSKSLGPMLDHVWSCFFWSFIPAAIWVVLIDLFVPGIGLWGGATYFVLSFSALVRAGWDGWDFLEVDDDF